MDRAPQCVAPGCEREVTHPTVNLCGGHYSQQWRNETLRPLKGDQSPTARQRFLEHKREIDPETGCWIWTGAKSSAGYGQVDLTGFKTQSVHRIAYMLYTGEDIGSDTIHHKCANSLCFNPEHLERASMRDNVLEMHERKALKARIAELEAALRAA